MQARLGHGGAGAILLPPIAAVDGCLASVRFCIGTALTVQDDHPIDDVPTMHASQGKDSGASLIENLRHS